MRDSIGTSPVEPWVEGGSTPKKGLGEHNTKSIIC